MFTDAMLASGVILGITFILIFTEQLHGLERSKIASAGAVVMVLVGQLIGFYSPVQAIEAIDWNVIFLLAAMMMVISIMIPTGGFNNLAFRLAQFSRGRLFFMMVLLGTAVTLLSLLLDNVTTVVIFGPLIILIARAQKVSPIPYLMAAALLTDTGGIGTLVGDPPNIMIGSAADIDFNTFAIRMMPIVFVAWLAIIISLKFLFRRELAVQPASEFGETVAIKDPRTWRISLIVLGVMVVLFILHDTLHWQPWFVAAIGMSTLVLLTRKIHMDHAVEHVEIPLLIFFISLFMVVGGVEHSGFLSWVGQFILPFVREDLLLATIVLMWVAAILSAAIDNIPFTAAMIPIILSMESQGINVTPLWWALSMGVGLGGNGTHIGSTANVYIVTISERLAREENDASLAITPGVWFRTGTPAMLASLVAATIIFIFFFDYFAKPIH